ncbi:agmatine deiminase family protein [Bacillaceae bacterium Marseille-Q3522]|nr:agmatine deiminase family protein [Bacillaceae bacterium Marseille-Q3522]
MNARDRGYFMPPEWAEHERTFLSWPVQESMVYPEDKERVEKGYQDMIEAIAEFEPVTVLVNSGQEGEVRTRLQNKQIDVLEIPHNDAWLRDNGPTFVLDKLGNRAGINWHFNAWGEKYAPWDLDNEVAGKLLAHYGIKTLDVPLVLEGGSIHVDGEGTLLTTEECLLNANRNPALTRAQIEDYLKKSLHIEKIIWLKRGLSGDETDGHIDNVACFAAPGKVLVQVCHDPTDENYQRTQENLQILRDMKDAKGRSLEIIEIEQPPMQLFNDRRLTLSYLNFYFVNGGIILPVFGGSADKTDKQAIATLQRIFPKRHIRPVDGMAIIKEGGNIHCATQQMPTRYEKEVTE